MPRRGVELVQPPIPPKKRIKLVEEPAPSLDASFCDNEALPPGIVFSDVQQKKWRIGKPIGRGSFGRIYLASDDVDNEVTKANARYVVKIEPHTNGPLFVEVHCLIRTAQVDQVKAWRQRNKQKRLGMPVYIASGSFTDETADEKYRFLVLPRYDIDLQKIIARTKVLDPKNVLVLAVQILDVLEYLHNEGYTHSDIKSSNLMLGFGKINKSPSVKLVPSFQKETKQVAVLSGKQRRPKSGKTRVSNYYEDEDFIVKDFKSNDNSEEEEDNDKRLANVKKKLRKILSDRDSRTLHRHHAFNLRQLSHYVNYEDMNSSVCSDQSYQKLLDDFGHKQLIRTSEEFYEDVRKKNVNKTDSDSNLNEIHKEAILSQSNGQIYLLDYGLASKFLDSEGNHKEFCMDARKAHDGTLEYSSRDSHIGAHSRRSDLENLGYNLLDWLTGSLPWKTTEVLAEPDLVHALKTNFMSDVKSFLKTCFKTDFYPPFMEKYLQYVTTLEFTDKPDYDFCRSLFVSELLRNGYAKDACLNFAEPTMSPISRKVCFSKRFGRKNTPSDFLARNGIRKTFERENVCSLESGLKLELLKETLNSSSDGVRKPCTSRNFFVSDADLVARLRKYLMPQDVFGKKLSPKNLRSNKKQAPKRRGVKRNRNNIGKFGNFMGSARQFTWAEILAGNPEDIIRKERNTQNNEDDDDEATCKYRIRKLSDASSVSSECNLESPLRQKDYLQNIIPTYAMKEVLAIFKRKVSGKTTKEPEEPIAGLEGYTPAMIKVHKMKEKREAKEKLEAIKQNMAKKEVVVVLPRYNRSSIKTVKIQRRTRQKVVDSRSKTDSEKSKAINSIKAKLKTELKTGGKVIIQKKVDTGKNVETTRRATRQRPSADNKKEKMTENVEGKPKSEARKRATNKTVASEEKNEMKGKDIRKPSKNNTVIKSKSTQPLSKKKVATVDNSPSLPKKTKSPPRSQRTVPVPNNRIRLRSSKRK